MFPFGSDPLYSVLSESLHSRMTDGSFIVDAEGYYIFFVETIFLSPDLRHLPMLSVYF
jgi:hypothetical protein